MVASIGKGTVAQYCLRRTEYSHTRHQVGQTVEAHLFEKLYAGIGPDGERSSPMTSESRADR